MISKNLSKIKKRISQLLAMADSTNHPDEAASFAEKARALMDEHNLSLGDAVAEENPLGETSSEVAYAQRQYFILASAAAHYFGCEAMFQSTASKGFRIFGRESARVTVELMIPYWVKECRRLGNQLSKKTGMDRRKAIHHVMDEFSLRLYALCEENPAQAVHSSLPVPIDEAKSLLPDHQAVKTRMERSAEAEQMASQISVSRQMGTGESTLRIGG